MRALLLSADRLRDQAEARLASGDLESLPFALWALVRMHQSGGEDVYRRRRMREARRMLMEMNLVLAAEIVVRSPGSGWRRRLWVWQQTCPGRWRNPVLVFGWPRLLETRLGSPRRPPVRLGVWLARRPVKPAPVRGRAIYHPDTPFLHSAAGWFSWPWWVPGWGDMLRRFEDRRLQILHALAENPSARPTQPAHRSPLRDDDDEPLDGSVADEWGDAAQEIAEELLEVELNKWLDRRVEVSLDPTGHDSTPAEQDSDGEEASPETPHTDDEEASPETPHTASNPPPHGSSGRSRAWDSDYGSDYGGSDLGFD